MRDLKKAAYDLGYRHGSQLGHPFQPRTDYPTEARLAYGRGFDDGVDDATDAETRSHAKPLHQE